MKLGRIIILAGKGVSSHIVYHALAKDFDIVKVVFEDAASRKLLIRKRIKRFGWMKVAGQLMFQTTIPQLLRKTSKRRIAAILERNGLTAGPIPADKAEYVHSINDPKTIDILREKQPDIVVVNGTRIISEKILNAVNIPFVNTHAGITPKYRNVHGAYWALVERDPEHCGVTVHLVDKGIDTGKIIYQRPIRVTPKDNFSTYPFLQVAEGVLLMKRALDDILAGQLQLREGPKESKLWYHPTIFEYIYYRMFRGVK